MINDIAGPSCPVGVIFVFDESTSVGPHNFNLTKTFLLDLVNKLDIDNGNTRFGFVKFSTQVNTAAAFNLKAHLSVASVLSAIASLNFSAGGTNTHLALAYVRTVMLPFWAGDRHNAPNVVVVMTDGESNNVTATQVCTVWKLMKYFFFKFQNIS